MIIISWYNSIVKKARAQSSVLLFYFGGYAMTKSFWKAALIRALRTLCQTAVATIGTSALISDVNWVAVASTSALAAVLSILNSVATGLPEVNDK